MKPVKTGRPLLTQADNKALSGSQRQHLRLTWATPQPLEDRARSHPTASTPLNVASNQGHDFAGTVTRARRRFRDAVAGTTRPPSALCGRTFSPVRFTLSTSIRRSNKRERDDVFQRGWPTRHGD